MKKIYLDLICISLLTGEVENLFMYLLAIYVSSCVNCLIMSFADLFARVFAFSF